MHAYMIIATLMLSVATGLATKAPVAGAGVYGAPAAVCTDTAAGGCASQSVVEDAWERSEARFDLQAQHERADNFAAASLM